MVTIEVLVGMIGSGKTTYARKRAYDEGSLIVCHDDLLRMLHGKHEFHWHKRKCYQNMEERLVSAAMIDRHDIVIDRTNLTHESRKRWIDFYLTEKYRFKDALPLEIVAVVFPIETPEVHASRRFLSDPRGRSFEEWLEVANKHYEQAMGSPVDEDEGFTRVDRRGEIWSAEDEETEEVADEGPPLDPAAHIDRVIRLASRDCRRKVAIAQRSEDHMMMDMLNTKSELGAVQWELAAARRELADLKSAGVADLQPTKLPDSQRGVEVLKIVTKARLESAKAPKKARVESPKPPKQICPEPPRKHSFDLSVFRTDKPNP